MLWCLTVSLAAWRDANPTTPNKQAKKKDKLGAANSLNDAARGEQGCGAERSYGSGK